MTYCVIMLERKLCWNYEVVMHINNSVIIFAKHYLQEIFCTPTLCRPTLSSVKISTLLEKTGGGKRG